MKLNRAPLLFLVVFIAACAPKPEPVLEEATVVARNASVRQRNSSTSRTLITLNVGDKVDVLQRTDNWYRIRKGSDLQGWMEESTIVTTENLARIRALVAASQSQPVQNTAVVREEANLRIEPGRTTDVIRKLEPGTKVEVLERVTNRRTGSDPGIDVWVKVRLSATDAGWVFRSLLDFDTPEPIAQYTESLTYPAVQILKHEEDLAIGRVNWYIVGERGASLDPALDFDGIRVFTWNPKMHRYETAFRVRDIRGVYPLEVGEDKGNPTFRYYELNEDNSAKTAHNYVMYGVVTRQADAVPKSKKAARRK